MERDAHKHFLKPEQEVRNYFLALNLLEEKLKTNMPVRFTNPDGECVLEGCFFEIDNKTGKTVQIERFRR